MKNETLTRKYSFNSSFLYRFSPEFAKRLNIPPPPIIIIIIIIIMWPAGSCVAYRPVPLNLQGAYQIDTICPSVVCKKQVVKLALNVNKVFGPISVLIKIRRK
jgi:hypothetical protein